MTELRKLVKHEFLDTEEMSVGVEKFAEEMRTIIKEGQRKYGLTFDDCYQLHRDLGYTVTEKMIRFRRTRNSKDLFKVATYMYLLWRYHELYGDHTEGEVRDA